MLALVRCLRARRTLRRSNALRHGRRVLRPRGRRLMMHLLVARANVARRSSARVARSHLGTEDEETLRMKTELGVLDDDLGIEVEDLSLDREDDRHAVAPRVEREAEGAQVDV